jgi:AcrR family transcriptional regulator
MAKTGKDRKRQVVLEFRRSEILSAATKVFGSKGFEGTRMEDIAAEADLAKGTVYVYFHSKDEIYEAVVEQVLAEILALTEQQVALATDFAGRLRAFIAARLSYWQEKQLLYRVLSSLNREVQNRKRSLKWKRQAVDYLTALFSDAAERGEIPKQDFEAAAWALMDMIHGLQERRMIHGLQERRMIHHEHSPEEEVRNLTGFTLRALSYVRAPEEKESSNA